MFSTDYPHSVCLWPQSQDHIARLTVGMTDADRHKVLAGNAERVYGI
jgi:predicted TIM-barrel fold metal-dependent hydrolase